MSIRPTLFDSYVFKENSASATEKISHTSTRNLYYWKAQGLGLRVGLRLGLGLVSALALCLTAKTVANKMQVIARLSYYSNYFRKTT